jgi:hypothetical protein
MNYIQKAKDYASMVAYSTKGDEYTFDQIGLEYFLDSLDIDFLAKPKKEWVGLTDDEIWQMSQFNCGTRGEFAKAIEAKLKDKNGY